MNYPYLKDDNFLKTLDTFPIRETTVKIELYNFKEHFLQEIQGLVRSGNISVDSKSSMRRTGNLDMILEENQIDVTNIDSLISINRKIKIFIGLKNFTKEYSEYETLWFPMGMFVITSASVSHNMSEISVSIQFKDKMCLLNGDCGGTLPSSVTFSERDSYGPDGEIYTEIPTIYQIILELVNHFGGEQLPKIIISDLPLKTKQIMQWGGTDDLILYQQSGSSGSDSYIYSLDDGLSYMIKERYSYGNNIGYIYTDFTYPEELIGDAGNSVTDILDKIISVLGNYEYFYDIDGNFIFQEKKNYLNTTQATVELSKMTKEDYIIDRSNGKSVYSFADTNIISSYTNNPRFEMIKNDFVIWGKRETLEKVVKPIRYHLAIDKKPQIGNSYSVVIFVEDDIKKAAAPCIYDTNSSFPTEGVVNRYYIDRRSEYIYKFINNQYELVKEEDVRFVEDIVTKDWRTELYFQGLFAELNGTYQSRYYAELEAEWPRIYDIENGCFYTEYEKTSGDFTFWLDFIDTESSIGRLSIDEIGVRSKVDSNNDIKTIFEQFVPDIIIIESGVSDTSDKQNECLNNYQNFSLMDSQLFQQLISSSESYSAQEQIKDWLYEYLSYNESVSIITLPIYHLEPNTIVTIVDSNSGIRGEYLLDSFNIPLDSNSTMNFSASRLLNKI